MIFSVLQNGLDVVGGWMSSKLVFISLEVAAFALIVWMILRIVRFRSAKVREAFWLTVLLKPLVAILIAWPISWAFISGRGVIPESALTSSVPLIEQQQAGYIGEQVIQPMSVSDALAESLIASEPSHTVLTADKISWWQQFNWKQGIAILWFLGCGLMLGRLGFGLRTLSKLRKNSQIAPGWLQQLLSECAKQLNIRSRVELRLSKDIAVPMLFGLLRPVIVLPSWCVDKFSHAELRLMLMHELAHWKYRDTWALLAKQLIEAMFFFHPAVWYAGRQMVKEAETACDDIVVMSSQQSTTYANCLMRIVEHAAGMKRRSSFALLWTGLAAGRRFRRRRGGTATGNRIRKLLQHSRVISTKITPWTVIALLLVAVLGLPSVLSYALKKEILKEKAWQVLLQGEPEYSFSDVYVLNSEEVWVVGAYGIVSHTKDGGKTWITKTIGTGKQSLGGVAFVNQSSGWVVGSKGAIFHTEDGGENWAQQKSGTNKSLGAVTFVSPKEGWAVGKHGIILHTEDGGENWTQQKSGVDSRLINVAFADSTSGWVVGEMGTILHTEDGGKNWTAQESGTGLELRGVDFINQSLGWVVGFDGIIIHTEDGGEHWTIQTTGNRPVNAVTFFDSNVGWAVEGWFGMVLHTNDGGKNWIRQGSASPNKKFSAVGFANDRLGWAVGRGGIIAHTEDGGITWTPQTTPTITEKLRGVACVGQKVWAVEEEYGLILHTGDGGESWTSQSSDARSFSGVDFVTPNEGWAVGSHGTIFHTEDGGETWVRQDSPTTGWLFGVDFVSAQEGWAVGDYSVILHTEDGGESWVSQDSSVNARWLVGVAFVNSQKGWAVGWDGTICHTDDGGETWIPQDSGTNSMLSDVVFVNSKEGWVVGSNGIILHTDDGGESWTPQTSGTDDVLQGVTFLNPREGWVVGNNGTILHTRDGGKIWTSQQSGVVSNLRAICDNGKNSLFATGDGETILKLMLQH